MIPMIQDVPGQTLSGVLGTSRGLACRELVTRLSQRRRSSRRGRAPVDLE